MKSKLLIFFLVAAFFPLTGNAVDNPLQDATTLSITTGGTSQQIFAANPNRRTFIFQNKSDESMYLNFGAAATASGGTSILIAANGGAYECPANYCSTQTINVVSATTGKVFAAKQGP